MNELIKNYKEFLHNNKCFKRTFFTYIIISAAIFLLFAGAAVFCIINAIHESLTVDIYTSVLLSLFITGIIFIAILIVLFLTSGIFIFSHTKTETEDISVPQNTEVKSIEYNLISNKKNALIKKLLKGIFEYSLEEMGELGIDFSYPYFGVIMARLDHFKEIEAAAIPLVKYGVMNIGDEIFSEICTVHSVESSEYDIAWIVNYSGNPDFTEAISRIQGFISSVYKTTASFGYDPGAMSLEDLSDSFRHALYALSFRISKGYNSIICYDEVQNPSMCEYPEELEQRIICDIKAHNMPSLKENVHMFIASITGGAYSTVIMHTNRLIYAAERASAGDDEESASNTIEVTTRMETLEEIENYILARCESFSMRFAPVRTDNKKDLIAEAITEYIDKHYRDSNLSIDSIADKVNRSVNYTRSIFKQSKGVSITEYITKKRFDEVCRLLVETNMTAQDISRQIGLNSGSYFYTAFKKYTGYTPDQYRKIHQNNNGGM